MKLLVGTVLFRDHRTRTWYELQMEFLRRTTPQFDHAVFLNNFSDFSCDSTVVGHAMPDPICAPKDHAVGLNALLHHARQQNYEACLLLDSDCFPYNPQWLVRLMTKAKNEDVAAVVQAENGDMFAHPSAFFIRENGLETVKFGFEKTRQTLVQRTVHDCMSNVDRFFPLLRSNFKNLHPLYFGLYGDLFYHHGAGTRSWNNYRAAKWGMRPPMVTEREGFRRLVSDPTGFIGELCGRRMVYVVQKPSSIQLTL